MSIDPVIVSILALAVSLASVLLTASRTAIDRALQWEQMRGAIYTQLAVWAVDVFTLIDALRLVGGPEEKALIEKLLRLLRGFVNLRKLLHGWREPGILFTSYLLTRVALVQNELMELEIFFEQLRVAIREGNLTKANEATDMLLARISGSLVNHVAKR